MPSESYGQKNKDIEPICECVKYIGNDTYVASFGYDNKNPKAVTVSVDKSTVIYNFGKTKKNANNYFKKGRQYNVFTQEFKSKDKCEWKLVLPNGTIKIVTSSSNSRHCRDTNAGLDPIFNGTNEGGVIWPELYYLAQDPGQAGYIK
ncbi:MAG: hypothetical protein U5K79_15175 [Cyclobacteriaceae bacterium]|nr:hypothetical protein [Cyclobacteriaceae bacterium]